jgi:hypothetical protein
MSKRSASRNAGGIWSPPPAGGNPSARSPAASGSTRAPSCAGSAAPTAGASTASIGPTAPAPRAPRRARRCDAALEDLILDIRRRLREQSDLGFYGAAPIRDELARRGAEPLPSAHRQPHPGAPPGWYLPDVAARRAELDGFDIIEGLAIKGGPEVEVLTGVSLHGGLPVAWPRGSSVTAPFVAERLVEHWRQFGLPAYAQSAAA